MTEKPTVSQRMIAEKIREGIVSQGWSIHGSWGSWAGAAEEVCKHLERKGIEIKR